MRVAVCFQLKKSKLRSDGKFPIYVRCILNGQRFEFSTNFFILSESQQVIGRRGTEDVKISNNRLDKIVLPVIPDILFNGIPIETVLKMLGHASLRTTHIYVKIVDSKISNDMNQFLIKLDNL